MLHGRAAHDESTGGALDASVQHCCSQLGEVGQLPGHAANLICKLPGGRQQQCPRTPGLADVALFHLLPFEFLCYR